MRDIFSKTKNYYTKNKQALLAFLSACFFVLILIFFVFTILKNTPENPSKTIETKNDSETCQDCVRRKIDGTHVHPKEADVFPIAVVFDNHPDARPPAGIDKANLVYEAEAEGRITRYLAFFANNENVKKIGPVRSARPYFVDWTNELKALFAHCGGSPEALVQIKINRIKDLNEFYNEHYFWRSESRSAPHNIFTSSELLSKYLDNNDTKKSNYLSWQYKNEELSQASSSKIIINYREPSYVVTWQYGSEDNNYIRYLGNKKHLTEAGNEIKAKNILIQFTKTEVIDDKLRLDIETIGENKAIICLDGKCETGEWRKKNKSSRTRFYYDNDEEVKLNAGTTWVQVVREEQEVKYE